MPQYRQNLPQLSSDIFIMDGGLETTLIFHEGVELPEFAAFDLLKDNQGYQSLYEYYQTYAQLAQTYGVGLILESATWRASSDWGTKLGYDSAALATVNRHAIALLHTLRQQYETETSRMVISGCVGPRGDGYQVHQAMTPEEALYYHLPQIEAFRDAEADMVSAVTMTYVEEAIGLTRAAQAVGMPVVISFTVETDGKLPTGQALADAIAQVDTATGMGPIYYMLNCAHPSHFDPVLTTDAPWLSRIHGLRANASTKSHAELDEAADLDDGNPQELGRQYQDLSDKLPNLNVLGGCCGTDHRHIEAICRACLKPHSPLSLGRV